MMYRYVFLVAVLLSSAAGQSAGRHLPIFFEPNQGQTAAPVTYIARAPGFSLALTNTGAVIKLPGGTTTMRIEGANPRAAAEGTGRLRGVANYYIGSPGRWRQGIPTYQGVERRDIYPGIRIAYYVTGRGIEYDFDVAPHADPGQIRLAFESPATLSIDPDGNLVVRAAGGEFRHRLPAAWQENHGVRMPVSSRYVLLSRSQAGFALGPYDPALPLVIDPVLEIGGYLGGSGEDIATSAVYSTATAGVVIAGATTSPDFAGGASSHFGFDAFVTALDSTGSPLFTTYLGGFGDDRANAICAAGNTLTVAGETNSWNFPTMSLGATAPTRQSFGGGSSDAFLADLDAKTGALLYATFLGGRGDDRATAVAADAQGGVTVTGETSSSNFPVQSAFEPALAGGIDAFVTRYDSARHLLYSTYLGGAADDRSRALAIAANGVVYVAGETRSDDFPLAHALQPARSGGADAFVASLSADGSSLLFSTYLGGSADDRANAIALDPNGNPWIAGVTASTNFPNANVLQPAFGGATDAFLAHLSADGAALLSSTFIGGSGDDEALALAVPSFGDVYIAGRTTSPNFPTLNPLQASPGGADDAFLIHMAGNPPASTSILPASPVFSSTYYGGSGSDRAAGLAVDPGGSAWIAGATSSLDLPRQLSPQNYYGGPSDAFFAKISDPIFTLGNMVVGKNLQRRLDVNLAVLPYGGNANATITSSDPAKVLFTIDPTQSGSPSMAIPTASNLLSLVPFYVQALDESGVVTYTLTGTGFLKRTGAIALAPSGFAVTPAAFTTSTLSTGTPIQVGAAYLDPVTHLAVTGEAVRGGLDPVVVSLSSSNPAVGTVTGSPLSVVDGQNAVFQPKSPGVTTLNASVPAGFSPIPGSSATATVAANALQISGIAVGKDLEAPATVRLSGPAPPGGAAVTIASANPMQALVSSDPAQPGSAAITFAIPAGQNAGTFYVQGLTSAGSVQLTASATGYAPSSAVVTLYPSGFFFAASKSGSLAAPVTLLLPDQVFPVALGILDPSTLAPGPSQPLRPGLAPVRVAVSSSAPAVASIAPSPLIFNSGDSFQNATVHANSLGITQIGLSTPAGFTTPSSQQSFYLQDKLPSITLHDSVSIPQPDPPTFYLGKDLQATAVVQLGAPAPAGGLTVTLVGTGNPGLLTTAAGPSVFILAGGSTGTFSLQGLAGAGSVQITASAPGYAAGTATVVLVGAGFRFCCGSSTYVTLGNPTYVGVGVDPIVPSQSQVSFGSQVLRTGLAPVSVEVQSSAPDVATVQSPLVFQPGVGGVSVPLQAKSPGTTVFTIVAPPGFATLPALLTQMTVTVGTPGLGLYTSLSIGKDLQVQSGLYPAAPLPAGQTVTITSSDPTKVLLSTDPSAPGTASISATSSFVIQSLAASGTVTLTATSPAYTSGQITVNLVDSGFTFSPWPPGAVIGALNLTIGSPDTQLAVAVSGLPGETLRGGLSVSLNIANSNPSVATVIPSQLTLAGGVSAVPFSIHPVAPGATQLQLQVPAGFGSPPGIRQLTVNVQ